MNVALITASGRGSRMHSEIPKQFMTIMNKPLIIYTLEVFQKHPNIDAICVPCLSGWEVILEAYAKQYGITKLKWIVAGVSGGTGQTSIRLGLEAIARECPMDSIVVIHDGNRPLVSEEIISNAIVTCQEYGSAIAVIPCHEVVLTSDNQDTSNQFLVREQLKRTQTPHAYALKKLLWAHEEAQKRGIDNCVATCDLMIQLGETVHFSLGSEKNMKITTPDDIEIFKALLALEHER